MFLRTTSSTTFAFCALALGLSACAIPEGKHPPSSPVAVSDSTAAQPFVFGEVRTLHSSILGQDRILNIRPPEGYSPDSAQTYPVIYVLDGSFNEDFPHLAGLVQFMNMYEILPKSIVVGIANVDRYHDFTHVTKGDSDLVWIPTGGGSAPFIEFIDKELEPFVDKHYRTNGNRTIIGQSLGGLLCAEILFTRPELFDQYVIVSPSFWWDNGSLAEKAEAWTQQHGVLPEKVFLALASDDDMMLPGMKKVVAALERHAKPPFRWTYVDFPNETHATVLHRAAYQGFEWMGTGQ